jgi:hypothetical protein
MTVGRTHEVEVQITPLKRADRPNYWNQTELKARGWTMTLIRKHLGAADKYASNPKAASRPPMKLFLKSRVELVESTPSFVQAKAAADKRRERSKRQSAESALALCDRIDAMQIEIPIMPIDELVERACASYNGWHSMDSEFVSASPESDPDFLDRICVNYLRHELTPYEKQMEQTVGEAGAKKARGRIRQKILDAISEAYPELELACFDQQKRYEAEDWYG